jgi:hypothetical protein
VAAWQGTGPPAPGAAGSLAFGVSLPRLRAGTLAPSGLLREAANPLGFGAGSDVFREDTGLRLDGSAGTPARLGVLLMPVAGVLGLYVAEGQVRGGELGIFAVLQPARGVTVDVLACAADPDPPDPAGQPGPAAQPPSSSGDWYGAPASVGVRGVAAARLRAAGPGMSASITAGVSAGAQGGQGHFLHAAAKAAGRVLSAALLIGVADGGWRNLAGRRSAAEARACARLRVSGPSGAAEADACVEAGMPPFGAGAAVASGLQITGALETGTSLGGALQSFRLEADVSIRSQDRSSRAGTAACTLRFEDADGAWAARCAFAAEAQAAAAAGPCACWRPASVRAVVGVTPVGCPLGVEIDARASGLSGACRVSVRTTLCLERDSRRSAAAAAARAPRSESWWMEAGFEELGVGPAGPAGKLVLRAGWETVSPVFPSRPPG